MCQCYIMDTMVIKSIKIFDQCQYNLKNESLLSHYVEITNIFTNDLYWNHSKDFMKIVGFSYLSVIRRFGHKMFVKGKSVLLTFFEAAHLSRLLLELLSS